MGILDDETAALDEECMEVLGEAISYKPVGSGFASIRAIVDYTDALRPFEGADVVGQDIGVAVLIADVPVEPSGEVRVRVARRVGKTFKPVNVKRDASGTHWQFDLKKVSA